MGNIDYLIPFFAFALGSTLDLHNVVEAGLLGVALCLAVVAVTGLGEGINLRESAFLSSALAQFVVPWAPRLGGLFCTGGETARALLNSAGAAGIRLVREVEPGYPWGIAEGWRNLPIVTKAGTFGTPQTLARCRPVLRHFLSTANSDNLPS